jgi:hypothetical protein
MGCDGVRWWWEGLLGVGMMVRAIGGEEDDEVAGEVAQGVFVVLCGVGMFDAGEFVVDADEDLFYRWGLGEDSDWLEHTVTIAVVLVDEHLLQLVANRGDGLLRFALGGLARVFAHNGGTPCRNSSGGNYHNTSVHS